MPLVSLKAKAHRKKWQKEYDKKRNKTIKRIKAQSLKDKKKDRNNEKNRYLKAKYGITLKDYNNLLINQNNTCAICKQPCSSGKALSVDHNHNTGKIRALLCSRCNTSIGKFNEDINLLQTAIDYLIKHNNMQTPPSPPVGPAYPTVPPIPVTNPSERTCFEEQN